MGMRTLQFIIRHLCYPSCNLTCSSALNHRWLDRFKLFFNMRDPQFHRHFYCPLHNIQVVKVGNPICKRKLLTSIQLNHVAVRVLHHELPHYRRHIAKQLCLFNYFALNVTALPAALATAMLHTAAFAILGSGLPNWILLDFDHIDWNSALCLQYQVVAFFLKSCWSS